MCNTTSCTVFTWPPNLRWRAKPTKRASHAHSRSRMRAARRRWRDSPRFALPTAESLQPKSKGGRVCELCEREKSKTFGNLLPHCVQSFRIFSTQRTSSVGASAWQASKPPSPRKLTPKLPPPDAGGVAVASPRPVTFPRRPPPGPTSREAARLAESGARKGGAWRHQVPDTEAPPLPLLRESGGEDEIRGHENIFFQYSPRHNH